MKYRYLCLFISVLLLLSCAKKYKPPVKKIEAIYLSSLYQDIHREKPVLTGLKKLPGIKIGNLKTDPLFLAVVLGKLGFYELLNETGIDFVIGVPELFWGENINYFFIPTSMGYAIKNFEGIRFAILCRDKDSLTIEDNVTLSLVKERSDILWVIDKDFLNAPPQKLNFFIKDRGLSDTTVSSFKFTVDTVLLNKIKTFRDRLNKALNKKFFPKKKPLKEFLFSRLNENEGINIVLYPRELFLKDVEKDTVTLQEILNSVKCELKFRKRLNLTKKMIEEIQQKSNLSVWGEPVKSNNVLVPDKNGSFFFDFLGLIEFKTE